MINNVVDTIVAIATPPGRGGVGIVRLSGPHAWAIVQGIFQSPRQRRGTIKTHHLYYGHIVDPNTKDRIDEVMVAYMRGPHSYTGEDTVEINGHGAPLLLQHIVAVTLAAGARPAEPGEMTLRAFLNGKIDLAQAEAVADLVAADSDAAARQALSHLEGRLSERIRTAQQEIVLALAPIEASIDFPEEEVPPPEPEMIAQRIDIALVSVHDLLQGAVQGRIIRDGIRCVLVGRPNVGKSSLLNALLQFDRAIVTPIAGTTRDTIAETTHINGIACHLIDTAGFSDSNDPIERMGIERSRVAMQSADIVLLVLDSSTPLTEQDRQVFATVANDLVTSTYHVIGIVNKSDLPAQTTMDALRAEMAAAQLADTIPLIATSSVAGEGIIALQSALVAQALGRQSDGDGALVARERHTQALRQAEMALMAAQVTLCDGLPLDLVAEDLHDALHALGIITGESVTEDLLGSIFSEFCIGK